MYLHSSQVGGVVGESQILRPNNRWRSTVHIHTVDRCTMSKSTIPLDEKKNLKANANLKEFHYLFENRRNNKKSTKSN